MRTIKSLLIFLILLSQIAFGQYYNERVLEKSFERTDFFFQPSYVNPYGIGGFGSSAPGLIDDRLLNLQINPAYLVADTGNTNLAYFNFRNSREIQSRDDVYYPLYRGMDSMISSRMWYPIYFMNTKKALEPIFSGAYIIHPLGANASRWSLGVTYQIILQDEPYYNIPQDIYKSNLEYDFAGNRIAEESAVPITDRYSGEDEMHQEGHFASLISGFALARRLHLGLRLSRVVFDREGAYGSMNEWDNYYYAGGASTRNYMNSRGQGYGHWDVSGGLNFEMSSGVTAGMMAGYLWGDVSQDVLSENGSFHQYGTIGEGKEWNYYDRDAYDIQSWSHEGSSFYGGINLRANLNSKQTVNLYYHVLAEDVDIRLQSTIRDTSYSNYYHETINWTYGSESSSALDDQRTGIGTRQGYTHRMTAALQWDLDSRTRLQLGVHVRHKIRETTTTEDVLADRYSDYTWFDNGGNNNRYYYASREKKTLRWDFNTHVTTIQIPILLNYRVSKPIEILFGVNRSMKRWNVEDVTLALFDYRVQTHDTKTTTEENFGERYTQPEEKRSDVTTTILGGLTVTPSKHFNVRLLVVPNFIKTYEGTELREFQWWIDFNLFH